MEEVKTNREIRNERLLEEAVAEVTESALANDVDGERVATALREWAETAESGEAAGSRE